MASKGLKCWVGPGWGCSCCCTWLLRGSRSRLLSPVLPVACEQEEWCVLPIHTQCKSRSPLLLRVRPKVWFPSRYQAIKGSIDPYIDTYTWDQSRFRTANSGFPSGNTGISLDVGTLFALWERDWSHVDTLIAWSHDESQTLGRTLHMRYCVMLWQVQSKSAYRDLVTEIYITTYLCLYAYYNTIQTKMKWDRHNINYC